MLLLLKKSRTKTRGLPILKIVLAADAPISEGGYSANSIVGVDTIYRCTDESQAKITKSPEASRKMHIVGLNSRGRYGGIRSKSTPLRNFIANKRPQSTLRQLDTSGKALKLKKPEMANNYAVSGEYFLGYQAILS